jgi:NAD(P)-dependent dehydrogenase (short-subunit alcohol dehydrogenase family)
MTKRFESKVAVVTGAGDGIGKGVVRRLAAEGATILATDVNDETGNATTRELIEEFGAKAEYLHTDVGNQDQVEAMIARAIDRFGAVDILVNNAWGGGRGLQRVENYTNADINHAISIGYMGPFWAMKAAFPSMKAKHFGRIINVCSLNGVNAHMGTVGYNSAKEGLRALSRTAAREWAGYGITCNIICPGAATAAYRTFRAMAPEMADAMAAANPMGRMGDPETDIAPAVAFLASEDSRYMTGNTLYLDGGGHINGVAWVPDLPAD